MAVILVLLPALLAAKNSVKDLPSRYRTWLTDEVNYIISNDEKEAFLQLPTDENRDKFIEHFWEHATAEDAKDAKEVKIDHGGHRGNRGHRVRAKAKAKPS